MRLFDSSGIRKVFDLAARMKDPINLSIGQPDFDANGENRWDAVRQDTLCWPYGICLRGSVLAVADSGNNRVMLWRVGAPGERSGAGFARTGSPAA